MRAWTIRVLTAIAVVLIALNPAGAADKPQDLIIAKWQSSNPDGTIIATVVFAKDGNFMLLAKDGDAEEKSTGTYKFIDDETLEITMEFMGQKKSKKVKVNVSNDKLVFMDKIRRVGSLEFRILANGYDDKLAIDAITKYYAGAARDEAAGKAARATIIATAREGTLPPLPKPPKGDVWDTSAPADRGPGKAKYEWVELGKPERVTRKLDNAQENNPMGLWKELADARAAGKKDAKTPDGKKTITEVSEVVILPDMAGLLFSRACIYEKSRKPSDEDPAIKKYEYFMLTRIPQPDERVTGEDMVEVRATNDAFTLNRAVAFTLSTEGGNRFYNITNRNRPDGPGGFKRSLAIILDGKVVSAPNLNEPIRTHGQIAGKFSEKEVNSLVGIIGSDKKEQETFNRVK